MSKLLIPKKYSRIAIFTSLFILKTVFNVIKAYSKIVVFIFALIFVYAFLSSGFLLWAEENYINSLTCAKKAMVSTNDSINGYWDSFYLTWISLTTIGFGDLTPKSPTGKILCIINSLIGILTLGGLIISIISTSISIITPFKVISRKQYEEQLKNAGLKKSSESSEKPNNSQSK
jgi:hypothetical protein